VVILDDSSSVEARATVDRLAIELGALVVRREIKTGFKAGNLNHFLRTGPRFEHYAILDSDEILQPTFVERALDHFAAGGAGDPIGVVQGRHEAKVGDTQFTSEFAPMLGTHVATNQLSRSAVGFSMFMGRGALLSDAVVRATGGFPEVVAEDVAFTIQAREAGFRVKYAPDIVSVEDFPIDYHAFKKQHGKMVQGATELIRHFALPALRSRMSAAEKLDLLAELVMIPLGSLLGILLFATSLVTSSLGVPLFSPWVGFGLAVSGLAPLLPEALRRTSRSTPWAGAVFLGRAFALYSSMFWTTLRSVVHVVIGRRALFVITPKRRSAAGWRATVLADLIVAVVALAVSFALSGSFAPAMTAVAAAAAAIYLTRFSGRAVVTS
jgi:cellulose synthase/poly-beta-1,6-N-acetylglucosamine synthase-like glycosyltransferase